MPPQTSRIVWIAGGAIFFVLGFLLVILRIQSNSIDIAKEETERLVPVEVVAVQRGPLSLHRTFSGTISPSAQFAVAPKVSGRIQRLLVDVSDPVVRGQVVVQMENEEFKQEVIEAEARLAVAEANRDEAVSHFVITRRQLERAKTLNARGIASESSYDSVQAEFLTGQSAVKVAEANLTREDALLRAARIRLGYTEVKADWQHGDNERTVAERFVDEGNTVAANTPILTVVEIDPVIGVIQVTEKDYPQIRLGQQAKLQADGFPDKIFIGTVSRISPIFRESSRQAEIEIQIANPKHLLKPGMFIRCTLELDRVETAISVSEMALTKRNNQLGVFRVTENSTSVEWVEVKPGFKSGNQVQLKDPELSGRVVTLGKQFLKEGSKIRIVAESANVEEGAALQ